MLIQVSETSEPAARPAKRPATAEEARRVRLEANDELALEVDRPAETIRTLPRQQATCKLSMQLARCNVVLNCVRSMFQIVPVRC